VAKLDGQDVAVAGGELRTNYIIHPRDVTERFCLFKILAVRHPALVRHYTCGNPSDREPKRRVRIFDATYCAIHESTAAVRALGTGTTDGRADTGKIRTIARRSRAHVSWNASFSTEASTAEARRRVNAGIGTQKGYVMDMMAPSARFRTNYFLEMAQEAHI
jgi:hypothetical protein